MNTTLDNLNLDILEIGNSLQIGGFLLTGRGTALVVVLPGEDPVRGVNIIHPSDFEFKRIVRQMDIVETELFDENKNAKMVVRKTQRQLDQRIVWEVFHRDEYTCRYCGAEAVPMTVDHVKLWEDGGETSVENLTTCCRKCNKTRGNTDYSDWLDSNYYKEKSQCVKQYFRELNENLRHKYKHYPVRQSSRRR